MSNAPTLQAERDHGRDHGPDPGRYKPATGRRLLVGGAFLSAAGIALSGTISRDFGGLVLLLGWVTLVAGLHLFGRSGSDFAP
jgi:hypothetical protein